MRGVVGWGILGVCAVALSTGGATGIPAGIPASQAADPVVIWTVGDLCDDDHATPDCEDVGDLIAGDPTATYFVPLGDIQYEKGTTTQFARYYHPKIGQRLNAITKPVPGNHEYGTANAAGYFTYFGAAAGDPATGYYSFSENGWRLIVLNSNCAKIAAKCGYGLTQAKWLLAELQGPEPCEIVFDHHPPITDGEYAPGVSSVNGFWRRAYENRAELFLSGHDHNYQRFAPRNTAKAVVADGVTAVVVGSGGKSAYPFPAANRSVYRQDTEFGALRLSLTPTGYTGEYQNLDGEVLDSFSGTCRT